MFVTVIALKYALLLSQWSRGHFLKLTDSIFIRITRITRLLTQRIVSCYTRKMAIVSWFVTTDSVTSLHPVYSAFAYIDFSLLAFVYSPVQVFPVMRCNASGRWCTTGPRVDVWYKWTVPSPVLNRSLSTTRISVASALVNFQTNSRYYSAPDRGAEYCNERVRLCLCSSVCDHIFGTTRPIFARFFSCALHVCSQARVAWRRRPAEAQRTSSLGLGYKLCAVIPVAGQRTRRTTFRALKVTSQVATPGARSLRSMTVLLLQTDRHTLHSTPRSIVMSVFVCFCVRCGSWDILYTCLLYTSPSPRD